MLIALHLFFLNVVLPQIAAYARVFFGSAIVICITLFGISMIFRAVGLNWFEKILLMGIGGIFKAIRYICSGIFELLVGFFLPFLEWYHTYFIEVGRCSIGLE